MGVSGDRRHPEPDAHAVLREIGGWDANGNALSIVYAAKGGRLDRMRLLDLLRLLQRRRESNRAPQVGRANRRGLLPIGAGLGLESSPALQSRLRRSRRKTLERAKRYVWWDAAKGEWAGHDVADFEKTKPPSYVPPDGASREAALAGTHPFIMQEDGLGWIFAPTHRRRTVADLLRAAGISALEYPLRATG